MLKACGTTALLAALGRGIGGHEAVAPRRQVIFVDRSGSIDVDQQQDWSSSPERLLAELGRGDSLVAFTITDRTTAAAPLSEAQIPSGAPDAGWELYRLGYDDSSILM